MKLDYNFEQLHLEYVSGLAYAGRKNKMLWKHAGGMDSKFTPCLCQQ